MIEDFEPIGVYVDHFGNLLEVAECEYCQHKMPIKLGYNTLLHSYDYKGRIIWVCHDCQIDLDLNK
jgi:hypothetical protein